MCTIPLLFTRFVKNGSNSLQSFIPNSLGLLRRLQTQMQLRCKVGDRTRQVPNAHRASLMRLHAAMITQNHHQAASEIHSFHRYRPIGAKRRPTPRLTAGCAGWRIATSDRRLALQKCRLRVSNANC